MSRIVSVSAAPYDGHDLGAALDSIAACGATHVEPAYIVGYTEAFDETEFAPAKAAAYRAALAGSGLLCHAMSSHIDLGRDDAVEVLTGRMAFAAALGAGIINTNAALRLRAAGFERNIEVLARRAEAMGLVIGLENPGNGEDNLFNVASEGLALVARLGHASVRLNYDPGNLVSHRPDGPDPARDAVSALPACAHLHLKDVRRLPGRSAFVALGEGDVALPVLLDALAAYPALPIGIELPLRLHRGADAQPVRAPAPVPLAEIERAIRVSLAYVAERIGRHSQHKRG